MTPMIALGSIHRVRSEIIRAGPDPTANVFHASRRVNDNCQRGGQSVRRHGFCRRLPRSLLASRYPASIAASVLARAPSSSPIAR